MKQRLRAAILVAMCVLAVLIIQGCKTEQPKETTQGDPAAFVSKLTESDWKATVMDTQVTVHVDADNKGYFELPDAQQVPFTYQVESVNDSNSEAKIKITVSDDEKYKVYKEAGDGTATATFEDKNLKLELHGMSIDLTPQASQF